jgi:hypothetical protein
MPETHRKILCAGVVVVVDEMTKWTQRRQPLQQRQEKEPSVMDWVWMPFWKSFDKYK